MLKIVIEFHPYNITKVSVNDTYSTSIEPCEWNMFNEDYEPFHKNAEDYLTYWMDDLDESLKQEVIPILAKAMESRLEQFFMYS